MLDTAHFGQLALLHTRNPLANQILFIAESSEMECFASPHPRVDPESLDRLGTMPLDVARGYN
jgi:hypothetical protein